MMFASPPLQQWKQLTSTGGPSPFTTAAQAPFFSCKKSEWKKKDQTMDELHP